MEVRPTAVIVCLTLGALFAGAWELAVTRLASFYYFYDVTYLVLALCLAGLSVGALLARWFGNRLRLRILLILIPLSMPPLWWLVTTFSFSWYLLLFTWPFVLFGASSTLAWHRLTNISHRTRLYAAELLGTVVGLIIVGPLVLTWLPVDVFSKVGISNHLRNIVQSEGLREHEYAVSAYARTDLIRTTRPTVAYVFTDGMFLTRSVRWDGKRTRFEDPYLESLAKLKRLAMESGAVDETVLLGSGAGFDVAIALQHGARRIDAIEVNADTISFARSLDQWAGGVYSDTRVNVHIDEARRFMSATDRQWDHISLTLMQTSPASGRGRTHIDGRVLTVEAIRTYLTRLKSNGTVAVIQDTPRLIDRTTASVLEANGGDWEKILVFEFVEHTPHYNPFSFLVLFRNEPFSAGERQRINRLASAHGAREFDTRGYDVNSVAITDNRPFLFEPGKRISVQALMAGLLTLLLFSIVLIRERKDWGSRKRAVAALTIGTLTMMVQVLVVYRVQTAIGAPVLALGMALASLLGGAGLGALAIAPRLGNELTLFRSALLAAMGVGLFALLGPALTDYAASQEREVAAALAFSLVLFCALPLGLPFIAIMQSCIKTDGYGEGLVIGCDGLGAILGAALATSLAISIGFHAIAMLVVIGFVVVALLNRI